MVVEVGLAAFSIGAPLLERDDKGVLRSLGSMGSAALIAEGLKRTFPETRPDRSDRRSFPSGHTSISFAAAANIYRRQGWEVGVPAHLAAAFVGYARVKAKRHHWYDVAVGAAIGETTGLLITPRRNRQVQVIPWGDTRGGGIVLTARFR